MITLWYIISFLGFTIFFGISIASYERASKQNILRVITLLFAISFIAGAIVNSDYEKATAQENTAKIQQGIDSEKPVKIYLDKLSATEQVLYDKIQWKCNASEEATDENLKIAFREMKNIIFTRVKYSEMNLSKINATEDIGKSFLFEGKYTNVVCFQNTSEFNQKYGVKGSVYEISIDSTDDGVENMDAILYYYANGYIESFKTGDILFENIGSYCGEKTVNGSKVKIFTYSII